MPNSGTGHVDAIGFGAPKEFFITVWEQDVRIV